jgi:formate dehydrogenase
MTNIICVLYDDPVSGYPPAYARDSVPTIEQYHSGQNTPSPEDIDFTPGELLGCVSGELGLREFVEGRGHNLIVTLRQGGARLGAGSRATWGRDRDLAAVLARLPDRGADRKGA